MWKETHRQRRVLEWLVDPREVEEISAALGQRLALEQCQRHARDDVQDLAVRLDHELAEAGRRAQAGQAVRVIEVPADAGAGLGIFEDLHGHRDGDALSRALRLAADAHNGTAGRAYAEALAGALDTIAGMAVQARNAWRETNTPKDADGQVHRAAGRFALVAAAGELAIALGIVPWPEGEAERAATSCFNAWLGQRGGTGPAEIREGIAQVRAFLEAHGTSRFEPAWLEDHYGGAGEEALDRLRKTINRVGFRRDDGEEGRIYCVFPESWRREVCKGFDAALIARAMADAGWLARDGKNLTTHVRIAGVGKRVRLYVITPNFLESDQ